MIRAEFLNFLRVAPPLPALTVPVERLPGGKFALAGCGVARGGGGRSLAAAPSAVRWDPAPVPHLLLFLVVLLLQVLLLLGAPEVGHVAGQRRRTWVQRRLQGGGGGVENERERGRKRQKRNFEYDSDTKTCFTLNKKPTNYFLPFYGGKTLT